MSLVVKTPRQLHSEGTPSDALSGGFYPTAVQDEKRKRSSQNTAQLRCGPRVPRSHQTPALAERSFDSRTALLMAKDPGRHARLSVPPRTPKTPPWALSLFIPPLRPSFSNKQLKRMGWHLKNHGFCPLVTDILKKGDAAVKRPHWTYAVGQSRMRYGPSPIPRSRKSGSPVT